LERLYTATTPTDVDESFSPSDFHWRFEAALKDDFNTAVAVSVFI